MIVDRPGPIRAPHRWVILAAAVALAVVWGLCAAFRVLSPPPGPVDVWWDALMTSTTSPSAHAAARTLAVLGTGLPGGVVAVVMGLLIGAIRRWFWGAFVIVASIVSALDVSGMKLLAHRARPDSTFGLLNAFPSGHTANAALLGTVVLLLFRQVVVRVLAVAWIVAMAWSRTQLHAHWMTDVLAAIVVGVATAVVLFAGSQSLLRRVGGRGMQRSAQPETTQQPRGDDRYDGRAALR